MDFVNIYLTFLTPFDVVETVRLYSCPVIANSKDFLSHIMPIGMDSFRALMDCFYNHVFFVSIHTSKQNHVVVSFVEIISNEENFGSKPLQSFSNQRWMPLLDTLVFEGIT